jgi:SAM-dependent methyltransferase
MNGVSLRIRLRRRLSWALGFGLSDRGERVDVDLSRPLVEERLDIYERNHLSRYRFAASLLGTEDVVGDFACGTGYGTIILAGKCRHAYGCDRNARVVNAVRRRYSSVTNATFLSADLLELSGLPPLDVVVTFETVEHVPEQQIPGLLSVFRVLLRPGGLLILSCPYRQEDKPATRLHHRTFDIDESRIKTWLDGAGFSPEEFLFQDYRTHAIRGAGPPADVVLCRARASGDKAMP